ncbi:MAG: pyridoxal phosphate-dependent aminotransferase [Haloarculaceae archaeon]
MDESEPSGGRVARRVRDIEPQQIRVMFDRAAEAEAAGASDLVHLELGEPDFETPAHVVEAAHEAATAGRTNYTHNAGTTELREAVADRLSGEGRTVDPDTGVVVTTGGVEALYLALLTVADPGEEVVVPTPAWPNPVSGAKLGGIDPVTVSMPADRGFEPHPDPVVEAIGPATAAVVLTSPSNPTGRVFAPNSVERVVDAAVEHDAFVLADEVYRELTYAETPPHVADVAAPDQREWVLTVGSVSKTYAMTGWRVGWLSGPADVCSQVTKIHESTTSCVNTPAQYAALAALTGPQEPVREMRAAFRERRDFVVDRIGETPGVSAAEPEGAFYAFVDVSALEGSSMAIAKRLLDEYGVVAAPGSAFGAGGEGHLRFSFANGRDRLAEGLDRFESMVRDELDG